MVSTKGLRIPLVVGRRGLAESGGTAITMVELSGTSKDESTKDDRSRQKVQKSIRMARALELASSY